MNDSVNLSYEEAEFILASIECCDVFGKDRVKASLNKKMKEHIKKIIDKRIESL